MGAGVTPNNNVLQAKAAIVLKLEMIKQDKYDFGLERAEEMIIVVSSEIDEAAIAGDPRCPREAAQGSSDEDIFQVKLGLKLDQFQNGKTCSLRVTIKANKCGLIASLAD